MIKISTRLIFLPMIDYSRRPHRIARSKYSALKMVKLSQFSKATDEVFSQLVVQLQNELLHQVPVTGPSNYGVWGILHVSRHSHFKASLTKTFEGHSNAVYKVIFMAGQRQLVSAGGDGLVKVWTIKSGECDTTLDNHSDRVWSLALARDEDILVSGGG